MTQSSEISKENNATESGKFKERRDKNFQSKVVIRRLPSTMTEEQFLDQISPLPENDYIYFVKADLSLGIHAFSRAYISFLNHDDILLFKDKFDGYVFVDAKGMEYPALVEFAPFQKIPKKRSKKKDTKCGTIEQDPDYIKFVDLLKNPAEESPNQETIPDLTEDPKGNNRTTPLIEFLKQRKLEKQKLRDEKREERKKRDLERKRLREEERRKRKNEKGSEGTSETNNGSISNNNNNQTTSTEQQPVELLKKLEREPSEQHHKSQLLGKSYKEREMHGKEYTKPFREKGTRRDWERDRQREKVAAQRERDRARKEENKATSSSKSGSSPLDQVKGFAATSSKESNSKSSSGRALVGSVFAEDPAVVAAALETTKEIKPSHSKEPRKERQRIRNKDRPSLEIYRPGMRRLSSGAPSGGSSRNSPQKENSQSPCTSPPPSTTSSNNNEDDDRPET